MPWLAVKRDVWNLLDPKTREHLEARYLPLFRDIVESKFLAMHAQAAKAHERAPTWEEAEIATIADLRSMGAA